MTNAENVEKNLGTQLAPCGRELINPQRDCEEAVLKQNRVNSGSVYCGGCASRIVYGSLDTTTLSPEANS